MAKLTFNTVAREICKREKSQSREVNITDVKRVMRHFFDILADDPCPATFGFVIGETEKRLRALESRKSKRPDKKGR